MKKSVMLFIVLLLFSAISYALEIDPKVEEELNDNNEVNVIIKLKENDNKAVENSMKQQTISSLDNEFEKKNDYSTINAMSGEITKEGLEELKQNPNIERVEYNYPVKLLLQDSVNLINASLVHPLVYNNINLTGSGQTICIIDTGIEYTHPAFDDRVLDGHCYLGSGACLGNVTSSSGLDAANDDNGHGTHVAGIASGNNTITGIAPEANLISIKVLDSTGSGSTSDIISGIDWCVSNSTVYNITVISMSLGTDSLYNANCDADFPTLSNSVNNAIVNNLTVVAATGNDVNNTHIVSPACITNVTSVGASTKTDLVASYSNRNLITDLFAPGGTSENQITSSDYQGGTSGKFGTSMATPHVAGAVAILRQLNSTIYPFEIENLFKNTGRLLDDSAGSELSFRIIDVFNASMTLNDLINPVIMLDIPNNTFVNDTMFNFTIEDHTPLNCSLYTNSTGVFELNQTIDLVNDGSYNITIENYPDGMYEWNVECSDSNNNTAFAQDNLMINIDTTIPLINYIINATVEFNKEDAIINWTPTDTNLDYSFVNVTYPNGTLIDIYTDEVLLTTENLTELGNYTVLFYVNDSANNINIEQTNIEVVDTYPIITLFNPTNITHNTNISVPLNFGIENNYTDLWYYLDNNFNGFITENTTFNTTEGEHTITLSANNTYGKESSVNQSFIIDATNPVVNLISPLDGTNETDNDITFRYNITDFWIDNCTLYLDNNDVQNDPSITTDTTLSFNENGLSNGDHSWFVSCIDSGNLEGNSSAFNFNVNVTSSDGGGSGGSGGSGGGGGAGGAGDSAGGSSDTNSNDDSTPESTEISDITTQQESQEENSNDENLAITGAAIKEGEGRLSKTSIIIIIMTVLIIMGLFGFFGRNFISRKIIDIRYRIKYR